jgi:site-specific DNA-methyltransferase (adenine-specific)
MKPVELLAYQITNNTKGEDIILDSFLGSGSTIIAAQKTGRICYGTELDPKYIDVIIQRYVDYTGNATIKKNGKEIVWQQRKQVTQ